MLEKKQIRQNSVETVSLQMIWGILETRNNWWTGNAVSRFVFQLMKKAGNTNRRIVDLPWNCRSFGLFTRMLLLLGLTICGHNCLLTAEWMSASKIVCRVGQAKNDKGDIIVTTKSGGRGTSTVSFKLLKPEKIGNISLDFREEKWVLSFKIENC